MLKLHYKFNVQQEFGCFMEKTRQIDYVKKPEYSQRSSCKSKVNTRITQMGADVGGHGF